MARIRSMNSIETEINKLNSELAKLQEKEELLTICCKMKVDKVAKQNSPPGQKLNPH